MRYVDTALRRIHRKVTGYGAGRDLVVKLFGGARVLDVGDSGSPGHTVGEQNVARALEILEVLGLKINSADTGSLDETDELENEQLWFDEAHRRYNAYKNGTVSARDAFEAIAEMRGQL